MIQGLLLHHLPVKVPEPPQGHLLFQVHLPVQDRLSRPFLHRSLLLQLSSPTIVPHILAIREHDYACFTWTQGQYTPIDR